jgi:hypothetical protein
MPSHSTTLAIEGTQGVAVLPASVQPTSALA